MREGEKASIVAVSGGIHSNRKDTDYWCHLGQGRMQCILITPILPSNVGYKELSRRGIGNVRRATGSMITACT